MSPDKQRIAIAEACGWKYIDNDPDQYPYWLAPKGDWRYGDLLNAELFPEAFPNYFGDLNAMHEAEKVLTYKQVFNYAQLVESFTQTTIGVGGTPLGRSFQSITSTASQRAEAFLRTIGKWEGAK
jgi:hypothetical protein